LKFIFGFFVLKFIVAPYPHTTALSFLCLSHSIPSYTKCTHSDLCCCHRMPKSFCSFVRWGASLQYNLFAQDPKYYGLL
jgi:hypothetical protein